MKKTIDSTPVDKVDSTPSVETIVDATESLKYLMDSINDPALVYLYCLQDCYGDSINVRALPVVTQGQYQGMTDTILDLAANYPTVCWIDPYTTTIVFHIKKEKV